jgi:hypothetical protein
MIPELDKEVRFDESTQRNTFLQSVSPEREHAAERTCRLEVVRR